jgi:tetratricopeptide (TPR) repeat protein
LLAEGRSWSGRERNCCFLNTADDRFANFAGITGLDQPSDGRAVGLTDWDGDGDLDLWISNRTAPRIELMQSPASESTHYLALRLVGTRCNRDAIGARVDILVPDGAEPMRPLVRYVKAGDGYLAQSSKWLHFGLGATTGTVDCRITWPDGSVESIGAVPVDRHYVVVQGEGRVQPFVRPGPARVAATALADSQPSRPVGSEDGASAASAAPIRIIPHARLPMPSLAWTALDRSARDLDGLAGRPVLLLLWASWCQPCVSELQQLSDERSTLETLNVQTWALNVEDLESSEADRLAAVQSWSDRLGGAIDFGLATQQTVEILDLVQRTLVGRQEPLPIPAAFLIDPRGAIAAVYKGGVTVPQLQADLRHMEVASPSTARDLALPFSGRWYLNPIPPDLLAIPDRLLQLGHAALALDYLQRHIGTPQRRSTQVEESWFTYFAGPLTGAYFRTGLELARQRQPELAERAWQTALQIDAQDWESLAALSSFYASEKRMHDALRTYRRMLQVRPGDLPVANNVAWILATSADDSLRNPAEAVKIAESICTTTGRRVLTALDTLAAAYAAVGRFDDAVRTADDALQLAPQQASAATAEALRQRRQLYGNRQAYRE